MKAVIVGASAQRDVADTVGYYREAAGSDIALRFIDTLNDAYRTISIRPASGSPRFEHDLNLPGLRSRKLKRFPYLVFYIERPEQIDVLRVLHAQRDIPSWMPTES